MGEEEDEQSRRLFSFGLALVSVDILTVTTSLSISGKLPGVDGELQDNPHLNKYGSDPEVDSDVNGVSTARCSFADPGLCRGCGSMISDTGV